MARAIKIVVIVLVAVVALLAATVFVITQVIDPNDFKPQIREQALSQANLELEIPGELDWQFWPSLGVSLGRTEARLPDDEDLFAAIDSASVSVAVWPLLFGNVQMDGVTLDGLEVNLVETADGANWDKIGPQDKDAAQTEAEQKPAEDSEGGAMDIPLTIPSVAITNGQVSYRNTTDGTDIRVQHFNFEAQDVSLDEPFPMQLSLRYQDQSDVRVDLSLDTTLAANLDSNHFVLDPMNLDAQIGGLTVNPVDVHLEQKLDVNLEEDSATISGLILEAAGTRTIGDATITGLTGDMKVAGQIDTEPFDVNAALKSIGETPIETRKDTALSKVALAATLAGPAGSVMADPLKVTLDSSTLSGKAGLESLDTGKIAFDLVLDKITLDDYLPPATASGKDEAATGSGGGAGKQAGTEQLSEAELIPVESLRPLVLDGQLKVNELNFETIQAKDLDFKVDANNGVLRLTRASGQTLNGSFSGSGSLDVSGKTPRISYKQSVKNMQLQPLVTLALGEDLAKGLFSLDMNFNAAGNSEKALVQSAKGNAKINLGNATVRGLNLYHTLVGGVNDMLGRFKGLSALIPNQESGKLPAALSEDTKIADLTTVISLNKQVANLNSLQAKLDKGTLSGNGWLNMLTQEFDLKVGMQSPELGGSKYLEDVTWPLRCKGSLAGSPAKWCGPDRDGFSKIAQQAAANAAKSKLKDKLGIDAEGDTTEEVLKNAAKKKAEEKIQEELGDKLKGLFNR